MSFIQRTEFGKKKEDRLSLGYRHLSSECLTSSYHTISHEVPVSQMMATQTSPQASHRASPALGFATNEIYNFSPKGNALHHPPEGRCFSALFDKFKHEP